MTDKIEQIIEILDNNDVTHYFPMANINKIATKIAALYSQEPQQERLIRCPFCDKDFFLDQVKISHSTLASEGMLLTDEECYQAVVDAHMSPFASPYQERVVYLRAQLTKCQSLIEARCFEKWSAAQIKAEQLIKAETEARVRVEITKLQDTLTKSKKSANEFYTKISNKRADLYEAKIKELQNKLNQMLQDNEALEQIRQIYFKEIQNRKQPEATKIEELQTAQITLNKKLDNVELAIEEARAEERKKIGEWLVKNSSDELGNAGTYTHPRYHRLINSELWKELIAKLQKGRSPEGEK